MKAIMKNHIRQHVVAIAICAALTAGCSRQAPDDKQSAAAPAAASQASTPAVPAGSYTLDKSHASLIFRVNHLGFSNYTARFKRFDAQLQFDPKNMAAATLSATVDVSSLETDYPDPATLDFNAQIQGKEFLDAAQFPQMTFKSTQVEPTSANTLRVTGDFTLHGVTRPVTLEATFNGGYAGHPMDPHARIGFSAHGALNRSEFGIGFGVPAPGTTMGVGDQVEVIIETEFSGPPLAQAAEPQHKD